MTGTSRLQDLVCSYLKHGRGRFWLNADIDVLVSVFPVGEKCLGLAKLLQIDCHPPPKLRQYDGAAKATRLLLSQLDHDVSILCNFLLQTLAINSRVILPPPPICVFFVCFFLFLLRRLRVLKSPCVTRIGSSSDRRRMSGNNVTGNADGNSWGTISWPPGSRSVSVASRRNLISTMALQNVPSFLNFGPARLYSRPACECWTLVWRATG